jgi:hypothetical protein
MPGFILAGSRLQNSLQMAKKNKESKSDIPRDK